MALKQSIWKIKGMQRDLSESKFSSEFSYENMNLRLTSIDSNTTLSLVNEKGTSEITIQGINYIIGIPIGIETINDSVIIFTTSIINTEIKDRIYKITYKDNNFIGNLIFKGDLNFDTNHPIETLSVYENDDIQKIYWTDGKNQPRVINVSNSIDNKNWNNQTFDFVSSLQLKEIVNIQKNTASYGEFSPGTIQYCFSYYNKYGQESNIFYTSPLYYCSLSDKGVAADKKVSNSFTIKIDEIDSNFDYLRIYSIHKSSENGTPYCKCVADLQINKDEKTIVYEDNNLNGYSIDPTQLLYIGGEEISAETFNVKDGVLFLGNIKLLRDKIDKQLKDTIKDQIVITENKKRYNTISDTIIEGINKYGYYHNTNQLNYNSHQIKTFKYLETYRLGIQLQTSTGKWSEAIFIKDHKMLTHPDLLGIGKNTEFSGFDYQLPKIIGDIPISLLNAIKDKYVKIRPVIVFPKLGERECICQGVLCPTIFNVVDRYNNAPFVQSSWYPRPNAPTDPDININSDLTGKWAEYRHYSSLSYCNINNSEIQNNYHENAIINSPTDLNPDIFINKYKDIYFIDKSIVTFHSPDIEFNNEIKNISSDNDNKHDVYGIDTSNIGLRIIGKVNFTANTFDIDINASGGDVTEHCIPYGFYKTRIGSYLTSKDGWKSGMAMPYWFDQLLNIEGNQNKAAQQAFVVYPWHRNGSLNNQKTGQEEEKAATIKRKVMSNFKIASFNSYIKDIKNIWKPDAGISGISIFNSDEMSLNKIKAPVNSGLRDLNYYGNVDKIVNNISPYPIMISKITDKTYQDNDFTGILLDTFKSDWIGSGDKSNIHSTISVGTDPVRIKYKSSPHAVIAFNYNKDLGKTYQVILPTTGKEESYNETSYSNFIWDQNNVTIKQSTINQFENNSIDLNNFGYLWLAELYNTNVNEKTKFGGTNEEAFENNTWLPAGPSVRIDDLLKNTNKQIEWLEGDTYYQRYDHLKTKPFHNGDYQSLVEIMSFMVETRVNLNGRYDNNKGLDSNLHVNSQNFNLINNAYNQQNNFFVYHGLNSNLIYPDKFVNTITWTKTKNNSELIDTWCNITMTNTLDLEGNKGQIRAITKYKDQLLAFQDTSISQILYNESTQISTTEGVPIEIANSGKVQGYRILQNQIGCLNKHSICETPNSLYFIDSFTKSLYSYTGQQFFNLSQQKGFSSYFNKNVTTDIWNPIDFNNFTTLYDKETSDVYFINNKNCLAFNETLGEFSSFYSYENTPYIVNIKDKIIGIHKDENLSLNNSYKLWSLRTGQYNNFFKINKPFYTTIIANMNPVTDKIFNQIEFRSDTWLNNVLSKNTFDTISSWNEYQKTISKLEFVRDHPSSLQKKFRIWRANIPRNINTNEVLNLTVDNTVSDLRNDILNKNKLINIQYTRDRIRNPWSYIQLSKERDLKDEKTILHDIVVNYFE